MGSTVAQKASETNQAYIAPSLTSASEKISESIPESVKTKASDMSNSISSAAASTKTVMYDAGNQVW